MNADDRNPNAGGQPPATPASEQQPVRRAGVMPPSDSVPQRTAFRPVTDTHQTGQPSTSQHSTSAPVRPASFSPAEPTRTPPRPDPSPYRDYVTLPDSAPTQTTKAPASNEPQAPASNEPQAPAEENQSTIGAAQDKVKSAAAAGIGRFKSATTDRASSSDASASAPVTQGGPRKVRVLLSRIDPWSALKIGFLLSIAAGIMLVVAVHVLWTALNSMGTFDLIQVWVNKLFTANQEVNILQFFDYQKVLSATLLVSVTNVVLISGLAVISAFLYNMVSRMVGGVYVTLTDD